MVQNAPAQGPGPAADPLRVALVLSGAVALGSFEAGVVHELLTAIANGAPITLDLIAGASAGGLVAGAAVRSLTTGAPYSEALYRWTKVTLHELTDQYESPQEAGRKGKWPDAALLSTEYVRRMIEDYLVQGAGGGRPLSPRYPAPRVAMILTLTNVDGLPGTGVCGDEYRYDEAITFTFEGQVTDETAPAATWQRIAQVVVAGAAFPGAFDPAALDWRQRLRRPGPVVEHWENEAVLARLHEHYPGLQAHMHYADGAITDNQPLERAIGGLIWVTGRCGEAGPEGLVFDPRRCFIFVEPDPPVSPPEKILHGPMGPFTILGRALRLMNLPSSPFVSRRRVLTDNERIVRLLELLTTLGCRMQAGFRPNSPGEAVAAIALLLSAVPGAEVPSDRHGQSRDEPGAIPPLEYVQAVRAFYVWLAATERSEKDLSYLERIGAGRLAEGQASVRVALRRLRAAYLGLAGIDPEHPQRYQCILEEVHAILALDLGLNRPWILLSYIAPEDPRLLLRGEEANHFGGFFSRDFLRHDFEVGRYYARQWLTATLPDWLPRGQVSPPRPADEGISWAIVMQNLGPLRRLASRLILAAGWPAFRRGWRVVPGLIGAALAVSALSSALWALMWPVRWLTGRPELQAVQAVLAAGGALFPLALSALLLVLVPRSLYLGLLGPLVRRQHPAGRSRPPAR